MSPDITIKTYYLQYIYDAKVDIFKYENSLKETTINKEEIYNYINENKQELLNIFNINLNDYNKEWILKEYNDTEHLYNKIIKLLQVINDDTNRKILIQVIKYCNILRNEYKLKRSIILATKRKNLTFKDYRKYISTYYNQVHKCVLDGFGYKFTHGIGTYCINYWKYDSSKSTKKMLDYNATKLRKKELLDKGYKLYNDNEAAWYEARGIPYDGIDYRVYKNDNFYYEITFINSAIMKVSNMDYKHTEYLALKYRGMSYQNIADKICKTKEDIYSLQVDIKYKLNILLYKYPNDYLNFIRNATQNKYEYRENHC